MKIIVADKISERGLSLLKETGWEVLTPSAAELPAAIADADALVVRSATKVNAGLLEKATKLRAIGRAGVGVDNVDVETATKRGVLVMNTPGGNAVSVAEHTLALMLGLARSVPQASASTNAGKWEKSAFSGTELRGKTMGLIGLGRVGQEVARRARALGMKVLAHDPYVSPAVARDLEVDLLPIEDILQQANVVSLHTSLSSSTENLINAAALAKMKKGSWIINCARGELIEEAALAEALKSGHIAGAGLDTFAQEPPKTSPLIGLPNVIATPHIAGSTREAQEEVGTAIAQQVKDYLADGMIRNAVNMPSLSADQYRRLKPYLDLGERLGAFVAQASSGRSFSRVKVRYTGEPSELGSHMIRSAILSGILNAVLDEQVNLVNAGEMAASRGLVVEETTNRRERGFPNTVEVTIGGSGSELTVEGTVGQDGSPRILMLDGIGLEAPLEGTLLLVRNVDVPGAIGKIGTALGSLGINIASFTLCRRSATRGADALSLVALDGKVESSVVQHILALPSITDARLIRVPGAAKGAAA
jgi:D-3-phosphoglycerate dehydrogenase / 2-oxoglutarate reductase